MILRHFLCPGVSKPLSHVSCIGWSFLAGLEGGKISLEAVNMPHYIVWNSFELPVAEYSAIFLYEWFMIWTICEGEVRCANYYLSGCWACLWVDWRHQPLPNAMGVSWLKGLSLMHLDLNENTVEVKLVWRGGRFAWCKYQNRELATLSEACIDWYGATGANACPNLKVGKDQWVWTADPNGSSNAFNVNLSSGNINNNNRNNNYYALCY